MSSEMRPCPLCQTPREAGTWCVATKECIERMEFVQEQERWERAQILGFCPTLCDLTCEARCHESHQVAAKRSHDPESCSGVSR